MRWNPPRGLFATECVTHVRLFEDRTHVRSPNDNRRRDCTVHKSPLLTSHLVTVATVRATALRGLESYKALSRVSSGYVGGKACRCDRDRCRIPNYCLILTRCATSRREASQPCTQRYRYWAVALGWRWTGLVKPV